MDQTYMKEKPILNLLLSMSLPMVISMLVNSLSSRPVRLLLILGSQVEGNHRVNSDPIADGHRAYQVLYRINQG